MSLDAAMAEGVMRGTLENPAQCRSWVEGCVVELVDRAQSVLDRDQSVWLVVKVSISLT